ncbi:MAG: hypothetical protein BRC33_03505 [Cyanobacteria bacterium SW_9_44_58]|nr:MAG: hypothetical protein BRC33_03505 [Cyanobacteria bacterium SW_9_44_58]
MTQQLTLENQQATVETFNQHLNLSIPQIEKLLTLSSSELPEQEAFQTELGNLDISLLRETLPTAKSVLQNQLPAFYNWLQQELDIKRVPNSPNHTTTWVANFLNNQESIQHLVELHCPVPPASLELAIPRLVSLFDQVEDPQIRQHWQSAVALLCLVLAADAREQLRNN